MSTSPVHPRLPAAEWRARLKAAQSSAQVLAVTRDYFSALTPFEWALLGAQPEATNLDDATRLAEFSYEVIRKPHAREPNVELVVATIVSFLSDAVARIAHLGNPRNLD